MSKTNPARGMRDFLPADVRKREYVIGIIKEVYESYGFEPLETPAVENLETLMGKYGEEGNQLIFKILKRGEKLVQSAGFSPSERDESRTLNELSDLALRYDLTVPLARVVAHHRNDLPKFFKRYQIQPVWRADRPARGRFREFYQCDVDAIGSTSVVVETELVSAIIKILERLGFQDFIIRYNDRRLLFQILEWVGIPENQYIPVITEIDKLDKRAPNEVFDSLKRVGIEESSVVKLSELYNKVFQVWEQGLEVNGILLGNVCPGDIQVKENLMILSQLVGDSRLVLQPFLARGLSYYTGAIFEINVPDLAGSLGGGGRYDGLIGMFGKEQIPACGFSLGLERILVVMEERGMFPPEIAESAPADVMVTVMGDDSVKHSLDLARDLREEGLRTLVYPSTNEKLAKQLRYAASLNIPNVAIVGSREKEQNVVNIRDLRESLQFEVSPPETFDVNVKGKKRSFGKSIQDYRLLERDIFMEFVLVSKLNIDRKSIKQERYPKPDFSCFVDGEKWYFELKRISQRFSADKIVRETLLRKYFTPDGTLNLLICLDPESDTEVDRLKNWTLESTDLSHWSSLHVYDRAQQIVRS